MSIKKTPDHHQYFGIIKATTEHWYSFDKYFAHKESNPESLTPSVSIIRRYDREGRLTKIEHFESGKPEYTTEYQFSANGQVIRSVNKDPEGKPMCKSASIFNKDGLPEACSVFCDMQNLDFRMLYSYDLNGKTLTETILYENPEENATTFFEHIDECTIVKTSKDAGGQIIEQIIEKFDTAGNLESFSEFDNTGNLVREGFYTYDIFNNQLTVKMHIYTMEGIEYSGREYEYLFDARDNWVRLICNPDDDQDASVCVREIEYY